jgi:hypothetical protein
VPPEHPSDPDVERQLNVESDRVHLIVTPVELDIAVDALRSVGNIELAARFEAVLRRSRRGRCGPRRHGRQNPIADGAAMRGLRRPHRP